jgi:hypothetical protein
LDRIVVFRIVWQQGAVHKAHVCFFFFDPRHGLDQQPTRMIIVDFTHPSRVFRFLVVVVVGETGTISVLLLLLLALALAAVVALAAVALAAAAAGSVGVGDACAWRRFFFPSKWGRALQQLENGALAPPVAWLWIFGKIDAQWPCNMFSSALWLW